MTEQQLSDLRASIRKGITEEQAIALMDTLVSTLKHGTVYDVFLDAQCLAEERLQFEVDQEEERANAERNAPDPAPMPITVGVVHADEVGLARYV